MRTRETGFFLPPLHHKQLPAGEKGVKRMGNPGEGRKEGDESVWERMKFWLGVGE